MENTDLSKLLERRSQMNADWRIAFPFPADPAQLRIDAPAQFIASDPGDEVEPTYTIHYGLH